MASIESEGVTHWQNELETALSVERERNAELEEAIEPFGQRASETRQELVTKVEALGDYLQLEGNENLDFVCYMLGLGE